MLTAQWDNLVPRFPAAIAELREDYLELGMPTPGDMTQPVPRNESWVSLFPCLHSFSNPGIAGVRWMLLLLKM